MNDNEDPTAERVHTAFEALRASAKHMVTSIVDRIGSEVKGTHIDELNPPPNVVIVSAFAHFVDIVSAFFAAPEPPEDSDDK